MNKRGFVSSLFLWYLLFTISIIGVIEHQFQSKIRVFLNMENAYKIVETEIKILDWIFCESKNNRLTSGLYAVDDIDFEIEIQGESIKVVVLANSIVNMEYDIGLFENIDE